MIIGVSGKIASGKDTVGKIIQYLTSDYLQELGDINEYLQSDSIYNFPKETNWQIVKFAAKLKQCVSIITGIPVEDLEKEEVKSRILGEEWIRYGKANGFFMKGNERIMNNEPCSKEEYEIELKTNWQTAYKLEHTPRSILQLLGTEVGRFIHPNIWINALFSEYHCITSSDKCEGVCGKCTDEKFPNWIITDMRYPNEKKAVEDRGGITIRVNRNNSIRDSFQLKNRNHSITTATIHTSETALDNTMFNYVIDNNSSIEDLIIYVKNILIAEKIIPHGNTY